MKILLVFAIFCLAAYSQSFFYNETLAKNLAGFSLASYCKPQQIKNWNCGFACEQNPQGLLDIQILLNSTMNASGYIGYSQAHNAIVVIFRGTLPWSIKNWLRDLNTLKVKYPYCNGECYVHQGFYKHFNDLQSQLVEKFKEAREKYPQSKVFVTGHSLGAAVAAHSLPLLFELNGNKPIQAFYNFGSPRVGDQQYSTWFKNQNFVEEYSRVIHGGDPVPHLPPQQFPFTFFHYDQEVFYKSFKQNQNDYKKCDEPESLSCARSIMFPFNIPDHISYFGWNWTIDI